MLNVLSIIVTTFFVITGIIGVMLGTSNSLAWGFLMGAICSLLLLLAVIAMTLREEISENKHFLILLVISIIFLVITELIPNELVGVQQASIFIVLMCSGIGYLVRNFDEL